MRHRRVARSGAALVLAAMVLATWGVAGAEEKPVSGLPVGGDTTPFQIQDITGPAQGKQLCYI
jgi:hypothetical protein